MTLLRLISRTLKHYIGSNLATAAGIAIATAVICGALIIGDSLKQSLLQLVDYRLGTITHTITAGDRLFTQGFAQRMDDTLSVTASPVLKTEAIVSIQGGASRIDKIHVWGVNSTFEAVTGTLSGQFSIGDGEAIISQNLASRLLLDTGDVFLMRVKKIGPIPSNTPFVSEEEQTITRRVTVKAIAGTEALGHFNLRASQSSPFNLFVNIDWLNSIMDIKDMANVVMIHASEDIQDEAIRQLSRKVFLPEDVNLQLSHPEQSGDSKLTSKRVFIDDYLSESIRASFPDAAFSLTYFVNSLSHGDRETPYSFVTALEHSSQILTGNETIINEWLANDLKIGIGDSLTMRYYVFGPLRTLVEQGVQLRVVGILSMKEAEKDQVLMPFLPGLSDAGNCRDWNTGIPIDLNSIRNIDEAYWDVYKGTPKAYISLSFGQELWQNQFGKLTTVILSNSTNDEAGIINVLKENIDPFQLEFQVNDVRTQGLVAAKTGVDFSQLFAGLGMFIILSGLLLTILLFNLNLKRREDQIRLFASLGFSKALIRKIVLAEVVGISLLGSLAGLFVSIGYSKLILMGLNQLWQDIVRTDVLSLHYNGWALASGLLAGMLLGIVVVFMGTRKTITKLNGKQELITKKTVRKGIHRFMISLAWGLLVASLIIVLVLVFFVSNPFNQLFAWFSVGGCLLLACLLVAYSFLYSTGVQPSDTITVKGLSWKNLKRNPVRSFTILVLLALGSFVIVITAANRKDRMDDSTVKSGGTGGFLFVAETTMPVLRNLNESDTRLDYGLTDEARFVQFLSAYDDDASCLNLNRVANPRILAVDPLLLESRFSFVSSLPRLDKQHPWLSLNYEQDDIVPAIADQTVIRWGLGKKTGDTLFYINARGEEVKLLLIGGLANSIFQGHVIISAQQFAKHFPASGGSNFILIEAPVESQSTLPEELSLIFRDFGWEMLSTREKMAEFNSIENTYLSIFFLMGAFGMLLGTIGLAIVIARSMFERSSEMALLKALGFKNKTILTLFFQEYLVLFLAGTLAGTLPAIIATLPTFLSGNQTVSSGFLMSVLGVLILNGIAWILLVTTFMLKRMVLLQALRND